MSVGLLPLNITCTLREQRDPVHTLLKKPSLPAAPSFAVATQSHLLMLL